MPVRNISENAVAVSLLAEMPQRSAGHAFRIIHLTMSAVATVTIAIRSLAPIPCPLDEASGTCGWSGLPSEPSTNDIPQSHLVALPGLTRSQ